jgi:3-methyladenine DNA glycosylase/8-oxoguanine DNA glycosylase
MGGSTENTPGGGPQVRRLSLLGAGAEPVDLRRTLLSHGVASLPPAEVDESGERLRTALLGPSGVARLVELRAAGARHALVTVHGSDTVAEADALTATVRHLLRLDDDLSAFYELCAADPELAWVPRVGAGRMLRGGSVFEDVVKTICTTNCSWAATTKMVAALVAGLGAPVIGAPATGASSPAHAFPTPDALAEAPLAWYRDAARTGYRGAYLQALAARAAGGELDLDSLAAGSGLDDAEVEARLLALPGVGPYAAAHIMLLLGRYSRLTFDSWTRPNYARLRGRRAADAAIARRYGRRYGTFAGLAFWLYVTSDWVDDGKRMSDQAGSDA